MTVRPVHEPLNDGPAHPAGDELIAFVDGDVSDEQYDAIVEHLAMCTLCMQTVDAMAELSDDLHDSRDEPSPATATVFTAGNTRTRTLPAPAWRNWLPLAASLVLVVAGFSAFRMWSIPDPLRDSSLRRVTLTASRMGTVIPQSVARGEPVVLALEISVSESSSEFQLRVTSEQAPEGTADTLPAERVAPGVVAARFDPRTFPSGLVHFTLEGKTQFGSAWTEVERYGLAVESR